MLARLVRTFLLFVALMLVAVSLRAQAKDSVMSAPRFRGYVGPNGIENYSYLRHFQRVHFATVCSPSRTYISRLVGNSIDASTTEERLKWTDKYREIEDLIETQAPEVDRLVGRIYAANSQLIDQESIYAVSKTDETAEGRLMAADRAMSLAALVKELNAANRDLEQLTGISAFKGEAKESVSIEPKLGSALRAHVRSAKADLAFKVRACVTAETIANAPIEDLRSQRILEDSTFPEYYRSDIRSELLKLK